MVAGDDPRPDLLRLGEVTADPQSALRKLHGQLATATEMVESFGDRGREGIFRAMVALLDYCSNQGIPRAALYPLQLVAGAVVDADRGVSTPAFEPDRGPGRPPVPTYEFAPRIYSAVVVECCTRQQRAEGVRAFKVEGAKAAERLLRKASWDMRLDASQLAQLREEISAKPKSDPMRAHYELMLDSEAMRVAPLEYAKLLVTHGWVNDRPA